VHLLNRYVLKKLLIAFLVGQLVYGVAFLIQSIFVLLEIIVEKHASLAMGLRYFLTLLPRIVTYTFPMAVMFSGFFVTAVLADNSELVVFNSMGLPPRVQARPYIWMGIVSFFAFLFLQFQLLPQSRRERTALVNQISSRSVLLSLQEGSFNPIGDNGFLRFRSRNSNGELQNILLIQRQKRNYIVMTAMEGRIFPVSAGVLEIDLKKGRDYTLNKKTLEAMATQYNSKTIHITQEVKEDHNRIHIISNQAVPELFRSVKAGDPIARAILVRRLCVAWLILLSPLFGFLIAFSLQRGTSFGGALFFSLLISYAYIFFSKLLEEAAVNGGYNPVFLVPVVAIVFTIFAWKRYRRILHMEKKKERVMKPGKKGLIPVVKRMWERIEVVSGKSRSDILNTYLYRGFLKTLTASVIAIEGIFILGSMMEMTDTLLKVRGAAGMVAWYVLVSVAQQIPITLPLACLVAGLFHLLILRRQGELTAMKAMGVSVFSIVRPALRVVLLLSFFMLVMTTFLSPYSGHRASMMMRLIQARKKGMPAQEKGIVYQYPIVSVRKKGVFYDVKSFIKHNASLIDFKAFKLDRTGRKLLWFYAADKLIVAPELKAIGQKKITLNGAHPEHIPPLYDPLSLFENLQVFPDELTSSQLLSRIREKKALGQHPYRLITDYYSRFVSAFSSFVLLLLGFPLLFIGKGRDTHPAMGFALAILILVVFYAVSALFHSMGAIHVLPPFLAAWSASLLFAILGLFLFTRVRT